MADGAQDGDARSLTTDRCPGDGEPCYVDIDPEEAHWRCGTVQCPHRPSQTTDFDVEAALEDPATILTHEHALECLDVLDGEIANIQAQIDAYSIESNGRPMPSDRQDWLRRAAYACAMRRNERHRVMQRDREIRGSKIHQVAKKDPGEGLAKQARFQAEAEARREAAKAKKAEAEERASFARLFMATAKDLLPVDQFAAIAAEAKSRRKLVNRMEAAA